MNEVYTLKEFYKKHRGKKHIIFICDHASNYIPKQLKNLGLSVSDLKSHITWDIGAKELSIGIARKLKQSCFLSNFSRLLIDPNRSEHSSEIIMKESCGIKIPGNKILNATEKKKRLTKFYYPYHKYLGDYINKKIDNQKQISLVSIHSFTKNYQRINRGAKIGLLWNKNMNMMLSLQRQLLEKKISFARNYPYSGFFYNYTLDRHSQNGLLNNICIEIRNDLLCNKKRINKYIKLLSEVLREFAYD